MNIHCLLQATPTLLDISLRTVCFRPIRRHFDELHTIKRSLHDKLSFVVGLKVWHWAKSCICHVNASIKQGKQSDRFSNVGRLEAQE